jgi:DNA-binding NarL/FixJ family response regulator
LTPRASGKPPQNSRVSERPSHSVATDHGAETRIVIAGEHPIFRHGLRRLLEAERGFLIVSESSDGSRAVALAREFNPDILLLGFATTGPTVVDTLRALGQLPACPKTILLSERVDSPEVLSALQLGIRGVVLRDSTPEVLFQSIQTVMAGGLWLGDQAAFGVPPSLRKLETSRRRSKAFGLTRREIEIIRDVVAGYTNREIAERSSISETPSSHTSPTSSTSPARRAGLSWRCSPRIIVCSTACSRGGRAFRSCSLIMRKRPQMSGSASRRRRAACPPIVNSFRHKQKA